MEPAEIVSFQQHLLGRMQEAYRSDLWAVAYIVNGGCSDAEALSGTVAALHGRSRLRYNKNNRQDAAVLVAAIH
jgi:hypothetical protein